MSDTKYSVKSGFYDAINHDRLYSADDMNQPYKEIMTEGIDAGGFAVTPQSTPDMTINVAAGHAFLGGKWVDSIATTMDVPANTALYGRIDSVILRVDVNSEVREANLIYRTGTPADTPEAPALIGTTGIYEVRLANITVAVSATAIAAAQITDKRGGSDCPYTDIKLGQLVREQQITDEVSSWLTEHVDPVGSAVVVDNTLSIAGAAADSKKTGDEISGLKDALAQVVGEFDTTESVSFAMTSGGSHSSNNDRLQTKIEKGTTFYCSATLASSAEIPCAFVMKFSDGTTNTESGKTGSTYSYVATKPITDIGVYIGDSGNTTATFTVNYNGIASDAISYLQSDSALANYGLETIRKFSDWVRGGLSNGIVLPNYNFYRLVSVDIIEFDRDVTLNIASGKRAGIHLFDSSGVFVSDEGWQTGGYFVPAHQKFKIIISGTASTGEAEYALRPTIAEFTSYITLNTAVGDACQGANIIGHFRKEEMVQGTIYNGELQSNDECISQRAFQKIYGNKISVNAEINWNVRLTLFDASFNYLEQVGYQSINLFAGYTITNASAKYYKISLSRANLGYATTTPDVVESHPVYVGTDMYGTHAIKDAVVVVEDATGKGIKKYKYNGKKIDVSDRELAFEKYMTLATSQFLSGESIQGSAVYGDYLFTAINTLGAIAIHNIKTKEYVSKITFTPVETYHCNTISFSAEKYDDDDLFPLLYVSMENASERKALVFRITESSETWSATLVQTINFVPLADIEIYYPNCVVDPANGLLYVCGYTMASFTAQDGNIIKVMSFALPSISESTVNLSESDVIDTFEYTALTCTQGMVIKNGKLYQCYGADWASNTDIYICAFNLADGSMDAQIRMNDYGYTTEPEALVIYNGLLFLVDVGGTVYQFNFY